MSNLTEEQKLVRLGLRSPNQTQSAVKETEDKLKKNIAEKWSAFQEKFEDANLGSWGDFETWLTNNGFSSSTASNIRTKFEQKYSSWSDFSDKVLNQYSSWSDFRNGFATNTGLRSTRQTDSGLSAAGIKVYEEGGVGRSGQSIPAGGVEVYGKEVHFSQTGTVRATEEESAGTSDPVEYANLSISETTPDQYERFDVSADVTNNTSFYAPIVVELQVDGTVKDSKTVEFEGSGTKTVTFTTYLTELKTYDVTIGPLTPQEVTVIPPGLIK